MRNLFLFLSTPLAITVFGLACIFGLSPWLAAVLSVIVFGGFLYAEMKEFV